MDALGGWHCCRLHNILDLVHLGYGTYPEASTSSADLGDGCHMPPLYSVLKGIRNPQDASWEISTSAFKSIEVKLNKLTLNDNDRTNTKKICHKANLRFPMKSIVEEVRKNYTYDNVQRGRNNEIDSSLARCERKWKFDEPVKTSKREPENERDN
ncbi:hypothetical protein PoB_007027500 [Plakobranchus ocellatus]|uniref:Uncharacterized protein n=1 Tax=Plakobranchus ocellatus TaxID=259542 RepID=A0AAV4DID2_9GAST|nr:hypothetical protein PoB_007027500 [Plakobranchus ocellatus]